jgi:hypothetical protein
MASSTTSVWDGDQSGKVSELEKSPLKPQPFAGAQPGIVDRSSVKALPSTSMFCVFHRQSSTYGSSAMFDSVAHAASVATDGFTKVPTPALVLAEDPANRSAFSHATIPDQFDEYVPGDS